MRAALLHVKGVLAVTYHLDQDYFDVLFESVLANLEAIFAAVHQAGRQMDREYLPEVIS